MTSPAIPSNYDEWRHCITVECGLELTPQFIEQRIDAMNNENEHYTRQFIRLYGRDYHQIVLGWFEQAKETLAVAS